VLVNAIFENSILVLMIRQLLCIFTDKLFLELNNLKYFSVVGFYHLIKINVYVDDVETRMVCCAHLAHRHTASAAAQMFQQRLHFESVQKNFKGVNVLQCDYISMQSKLEPWLQLLRAAQSKPVPVKPHVGHV
jgi:hypothetical protein